jgi:uncharacterized protein (DUF697 family)
MAAETAPTAQPKQSPKTSKEDPQIEVKDVHSETGAKGAGKSAPQDAASRIGRAEAIIRRNVLWSFGAGVLPLPLLDMLAVTGVQIKMLNELSKLYEVKFREDIAKKLLGSLVSSVVGIGVGTTIGASFMKLIPGIGTALGIVAVPVVAGAFTHATGQVFMMHFESGGTLLDFDPQAMRAHFKDEFEKAKAVVAKLREEEPQGKSS